MYMEPFSPSDHSAGMEGTTSSSSLVTSSLRTMTTVRPAMPIFFCAPIYARPKRFISYSRPQCNGRQVAHEGDASRFGRLAPHRAVDSVVDGYVQKPRVLRHIRGVYARDGRKAVFLAVRKTHSIAPARALVKRFAANCPVTTYAAFPRALRGSSVSSRTGATRRPAERAHGNRRLCS